MASGKVIKPEQDVELGTAAPAQPAAQGNKQGDDVSDELVTRTPSTWQQAKHKAKAGGNAAVGCCKTQASGARMRGPRLS